jgi:hypothetical protein
MILVCEAQFIAPQPPGGGLFYKHDFYFLRHVLKIVDSFRIVKPTNVSKPPAGGLGG